MAGGYLPEDAVYILRDQYTSPYPYDFESEARRLDDCSQPYYPDERSPLQNNSSVTQRKTNKPFSSRISKLSLLWLFSGESCFGHENAEIQDYEDLKRKCETQRNELEAMRQEGDMIKQSLNQEKQKLKNLIAAHKRELDEQKAQLRSSDAKVAELRKHIKKHETAFTKSHEIMVLSLSEAVSRAHTDDMIKYDLKRFYDNDLLPWCADMSSSRIDEPEKAKKKLESEGIINSSKDYMNEPSSLKFSMDLPHGRSSVVLLQAVLSQTLCETFLRDAYFLAERKGTSDADSRRQLKKLEDSFCKVDMDFGVDWRIKTVESLEKTTPFGLHLVEDKAKTFVQEYEFLFEKVDDQALKDQALKDLAQLFVDFGNMALKLWKMRTLIKTYDLSRFAEQRFDPGSPFIEVDVVGPLAARRRLQGRHIGVLVQPLIISEPLGQDDGASKEVVWLKAVGWISNFEGLVDTPM